MNKYSALLATAIGYMGDWLDNGWSPKGLEEALTGAEQASGEGAARIALTRYLPFLKEWVRIDRRSREEGMGPAEEEEHLEEVVEALR